MRQFDESDNRRKPKMMPWMYSLTLSTFIHTCNKHYTRYTLSA